MFNRQPNEKAPRNKLGFLAELSLGGVFGFLLVMTCVYYLLLQSHVSFISLNSILLQIINLPNREQIVAIIILPIYLASLIFGGSILGALLGHWMWPKITTFVKKVFSKENIM